MSQGWSTRRKVLVGLVAVVAVAGTIAGNLLTKREEGGGGPLFGGKGKTVDFVRVRQGPLESFVEASGALKAVTEVKISAEVVGRIETLHVSEGTEVRKGQILLELEPSEYQALVDRQTANLEIARASLRQTQAETEEIRRHLERQESLYVDGILSEQEIDAARTNLRVRRDQVQRARQSVVQARADLDSVLKDLAKTTIASPIDGSVTRLHAEEGEVVMTGTMNNPGSVILELADLSELLVEASVDQNEVLDVRHGQRAVVEPDALPDREFQGLVTEIASVGQRSGEVTVFPVEILMEDPGRELRPGMTANVRIITQTREEALILPVGAVLEKIRDDLASKEEKARLSTRELEEIVEVVYRMEDGRARAVELETGISDDYDIEILSGLELGEPVISGPYRLLRFLKEKDRVKPSEEGQVVLDAEPGPPVEAGPEEGQEADRETDELPEEEPEPEP